MAKTFEFFFDYASATAPLALPLIAAIEQRTGAQANFRPMFLGGVMQATGNKPPGTVPAKGKYMARDIQRCAAHVGIPFYMNPAFPVNTLAALRATIGFDDKSEMRRFATACFNESWSVPEPLNLGDPAHLQQLCEKHGFDTAQIAAMATDQANKDKLKANTEEAVGRGVFGAPSFFVGDELFFGHDRLDYVERALA
jgi:2-hydroxychromene-2-carboxylate isomerase